ncbi:hypothetical protein AMECASPLE_018637 [Ameca splendens]|uniref:Uncharacterized protein n=1 Tax=Ameca splendens TaxID=208324 RepID=A0ABV0YDU9_9TELE
MFQTYFFIVCFQESSIQSTACSRTPVFSLLIPRVHRRTHLWFLSVTLLTTPLEPLFGFTHILPPSLTYLSTPQRSTVISVYPWKKRRGSLPTYIAHHNLPISASTISTTDFSPNLLSPTLP